jgi:carboxymethylenebutenolidase
MTGRMIDYDANGATTPGYLATPDAAAGSAAPGVVVLHAFWGLTEPFRQACDRLAEAGYVALAPDMYRGKTTASVEEAQALGSALDQNAEQWQGDIRGAVHFLRQYQQDHTSQQADSSGKVALMGFSLGGAYVLDMSVNLADEIAAVVVFYDTYPGLDYGRAKAAYLCHYAEDDSFVSAEAVAQMERELQAAGRQVSIYTYPGTKHWFVEPNRADAYNPAAAALAWERTLAFLDAKLRH